MTAAGGKGDANKRRALLARLHVAKRDADLDEDAYRALMEARTGKRSARELSEVEIASVIDAIQPRRKRPSQNIYARKIEALWLSAWNLGVTRTKDEKAMRHFVERQTGLSHPNFVLSATHAARAIEALKGWLAREASVVWGLYPDEPIRAVVEAQWHRLIKLDAVSGELGDYAAGITGKSSLVHYDRETWLALSQALGRHLRRALARDRNSVGGRG
jgi:phage gp16-like protein